MMTSKIPRLPDMQRGVYLFHFDPSNCSRRVRHALEEKGVAWTSVFVDLMTNEHADPHYIELNPKGVVPTLVHDGRVVCDSNRIIHYIDDALPGPRLMPTSEPENAEVLAMMARTDAIHEGVKAVTFERLVRTSGWYTDKYKRDASSFRALHPNANLSDFLDDFVAEDQTRWKRRLADAHAAIESSLGDLERRLEGRDWLTGDAFGLGDVTWIAHVHHLEGTGYDIARFPRVVAWAERVRARPAYRAAVTNYKP